MNLPKVSVVVPVYNTSQLIGKCVESLLNQSLSDLEIIVVNDGSTDDSHEQIQKLAVRDSRIQYINLEKNAGTFHARLAGIKKAAGRYVGTVDSDDWVHQDMYSKLLEEAETHEADIVECMLWSVSADGTRKKLFWSDHYKRELAEQEIIENVVKRQVWHIAANKIFKRSLIEKNLQFYESVQEKVVVADDKLLTMPLFLSARKFRSIPERMYFYFERNDSSSNKRNLEHELRHIRDTKNVDRHIRSLFVDSGVNSQLMEFMEDNEREELVLSLRNISTYDCDSPERVKLYDTLNAEYGSRFLRLMFGQEKRDPVTGEIVVSKKTGLLQAIQQVGYAEKYLYLLLKEHHPALFFLFLPLHLMLNFFVWSLGRLISLYRRATS